MPFGRVSAVERPEVARWNDTVEAVARLIDDLGGRGVLVGGTAFSLTTEARYTRDVDAMLFLGEEPVDKTVDLVLRRGFRARVKDPLEMARRQRMLLVTHPDQDVDVDLSLGWSPFEREMVERSSLEVVNGVPLRLPTPDDLFIMKAIAGRDVDLLDMRRILQVHKTIDRERIRHWIRQFAEITECPEMLETAERLFADEPG